MRKIQSASEIAEKEAKTKKIGGIVIIILLLLGTAGFALNGVGIKSDNSAKDGLIFDGQSWNYFLGGQPIYRFTYGLGELNFTDVNIAKSVVDFSGRSLYLDSENGIGVQEIALNLGRHAGKIGEACYGSCEKDLPELTCDGEEILIVISNNSLGVNERDNCIFIAEDLKVVDAFLYRILGIN